MLSAFKMYINASQTYKAINKSHKIQSTNYLLIAIIEVNPSAWKNSISELHLAQDYLNNFWAVCVEGGCCLLLLLSQVCLK